MFAFFLTKRSWSPAAMWTTGTALALAIIPLLMWSGHLYYADGGQSPDGPGMLLMSVVATIPIWLGCWLAFLALFLVGYKGGATLLPLRAPTIWSAILAVAATATTGVFLWLAISAVEFWRVTRLPFTLHLLSCAFYCQLLRGAAAARSRSPRDRRLQHVFE